jgi:hypothetical protein
MIDKINTTLVATLRVAGDTVMAFGKKKQIAGSGTGALIGGAVGGPVGAGIGYAIGGLAGFIGGGGKAKKGYSTAGTGPVLPEGPALPPYAQTSNSHEHDASVMKGRMTKKFY